MAGESLFVDFARCNWDVVAAIIGGIEVGSAVHVSESLRYMYIIYICTHIDRQRKRHTERGRKKERCIYAER